MAKREPKVGEFWWARPPDGDAEPVSIVQLSDTGDHQLQVLGSGTARFAKQWSLIRRIAGQPQ